MTDQETICKLKNLPEPSLLCWKHLPPMPLSWLITSVTEDESGEAFVVWQVTPSWRDSRMGEPRTAVGRAAARARMVVVEKYIWWVGEYGMLVSAAVELPFNGGTPTLLECGVL